MGSARGAVFASAAASDAFWLLLITLEVLGSSWRLGARCAVLTANSAPALTACLWER